MRKPPVMGRAKVRPTCDHEGTLVEVRTLPTALVPVPELVAHLCTQCDEQLPADLPWFLIQMAAPGSTIVTNRGFG